MRPLDAGLRRNDEWKRIESIFQPGDITYRSPDYFTIYYNIFIACKYIDIICTTP